MKRPIIILLLTITTNFYSCDSLCEGCGERGVSVVFSIENLRNEDLDFYWYYREAVLQTRVTGKKTEILYDYKNNFTGGSLIREPFNFYSPPADNFIPFDSVLVYQDTILLHRFLLDSCIVQKGPMCEAGWKLISSVDTDDSFFEEWLYTIE